MPTLQCHEWQVDFLDEGDGAPVVLVHSSVSGNRQWKRLVESLRGKGRRVLAPNLLGYGGTSPWERGQLQTIEAAADVVMAVCEHAGAGPLQIVGHSWGATLAMACAARLGDRVTRLALFEPMVTGVLQRHGSAVAMAEAARMYQIVRRLGDARQWESLAEIFTDYFNGDGSWAETPPERRRLVAQMLPPNRREWDAGARPFDDALLERITARTLLLRGTRTRAATREICDILARLKPQWALREFEGVGHMGPLTHATVVNAAIEEFLDAA